MGFSFFLSFFFLFPVMTTNQRFTARMDGFSLRRLLTSSSLKRLLKDRKKAEQEEMMQVGVVRNLDHYKSCVIRKNAARKKSVYQWRLMLKRVQAKNLRPTIISFPRMALGNLNTVHQWTLLQLALPWNVYRLTKHINPLVDGSMLMTRMISFYHCLLVMVLLQNDAGKWTNCQWWFSAVFCFADISNPHWCH